ncbi:MAG: T9SS type A sorting domain-containing protein [Chitinophagaceae bacterium]|nr:T9SS type A sorting domain-containing protein [Chitinophagaceae bacterium]
MPLYLQAQICSSFAVTYISYESRCAATGSIKVNATGGSGNYKYKVAGTISTNFTSTDSITGLPAGVYTLTVTDIVTNCTINIANVSVAGTYRDPRFTLNSVDVSCDNGSNGSISLATRTFGRGPFRYSIVAPSPMGVGTTNSTGTFNNLSAGVYTIRLTDSCGGIQSRLVTINNYTWKIDSVRFTKFSCDSATGYVRVSDSRGNISTVSGIPGLLYGVVRGAGDTIWSSNPSFTFYLGGQNTFEVVVKDACGKIKKFPVTVSFKPTVGASVNVHSINCNWFSASVTGVSNFFDPEFCLTDSSGLEIVCNSTGVFNNIGYGSYCIKAHDSCSDTTITRCFTVSPPPISVGSIVNINHKTCFSFSASVTGQVGLTNPEYCLYDSANNLIGCNNSGVFNNLVYGSYCINTTDTCRDTTIQRCFTAVKPVPVVQSPLSPGYLNCNNFGVTVTGDSLTNPSYCLYDSLGQVVLCNNTGVFDSLQYGSYCISVYDSCYDTTITRCISIFGPSVINNISSQISNRACSTFTASVNGSNLISPLYCLYKSDSTLVVCNNSGVFDNLTYGSYFVSAHNSCPDTTFTYNITAIPPLPSISSNVAISNRTCGTFSVNTSGGQNITNPKYCLYDSANVKLICNTTGVFTNLAYGSYCIKLTDGCYDTTISRCFTAAPLPVSVAVTAKKSCAYGFSKLSITVSGGVVPVNIRVYNPNGDLFFAGSYNSTSITIDSVPGTLIGETYKILATDNCGNTDSATTATVASIISHIPTVVPKCPSSTWLNGSGSIVTTASSNTGSLTVRIIKKNNTTLSSSLIPNTVAGSVFTFNNLEPAVYIIRYKANDACNRYFYDTVTIAPYQYPTLDRSSAYQCDQNGFSLGAVVSNGVGPFTYEIIGSSPSTPSIVTAPQTSPVFTINNGTTYSLVRLRALDACGNASLEDASILPLANNGIISDFNCFQLYTTLRVDTLYNSTYAWYLKHTIDGADSTYLGGTYSIYLPNGAPVDTGLYVCHLVVNSGCIKRTYYYRLDGSCYHYLPVSLEQFSGKYIGNKIALNWRIAANADVKKFVVERKTNGTLFSNIGSVNVLVNSSAAATYQFLDGLPDPEKNYYRLKMVHYNNTVTYSNVILLGKKKLADEISIYPNPVHTELTVEFKEQAGHSFKVVLMNMLNQAVREIEHTNSIGGSLLQIKRTGDMQTGLYILKLMDLTTKEEVVQKIIFQ